LAVHSQEAWFNFPMQYHVFTSVGALYGRYGAFLA